MIRYRRWLPLAFALWPFSVRQTWAQTPSRGPDDVVRAVLRADSSGDWRSVLAFAHPDAISEFRDYQIRTLTTSRDDFPAMRELSQCMKDQIARDNKFQLDSIYHVASVADLQKLSADTVFARYRRWQSTFPPFSPTDTVMPAPRRSYLGHLSADDSTAYGIILEQWDRLPMPDWPARRPQIITVRRVGREWRTMLDVDFLAAGLRFHMVSGCH